MVYAEISEFYTQSAYLLLLYENHMLWSRKYVTAQNLYVFHTQNLEKKLIMLSIQKPHVIAFKKKTVWSFF